MEKVAFIIAIFGLIAFHRLNKLVRELKRLKILNKDYKKD